jgi:hypothetical protein
MIWYLNQSDLLRLKIRNNLKLNDPISDPTTRPETRNNPTLDPTRVNLIWPDTIWYDTRPDLIRFDIQNNLTPNYMIPDPNSLDSIFRLNTWHHLKPEITDWSYPTWLIWASPIWFEIRNDSILDDMIIDPIRSDMTRNDLIPVPKSEITWH